VDRATFDLEKIDAIFRKWFEGGKERAGTVSEAHGERNFASLDGNPQRRFVFRKQQHEAGEILGVVLDALGENHGVVMFSGVTPGDGGAGFVAPS
jgi:hypothetical protein